jgi:hypothetical protein
VTARGRGCEIANGVDARNKVPTSEFIVPHQLVVSPLFYRDMSICVVDEARPNPKRFCRAIFSARQGG